MLFWNKICCIFLIIFFAALSCKAQLPAHDANPALLTYNPVLFKGFITDKINNNSKKNLLPPITVIPQDYYTQHFGMMCKKELAIEKATKIPLRFRLGSLQQCNYLEGKNN
jgi:hypothetical protein